MEKEYKNIWNNERSVEIEFICEKMLHFDNDYVLDVGGIPKNL